MKKRNKTVGHPSGSRENVDHVSRDGHPSIGKNGGETGECARRVECRLPKSEGGVWHCEEYVEEI